MLSLSPSLPPPTILLFSSRYASVSDMYLTVLYGCYYSVDTAWRRRGYGDPHRLAWTFSWWVWQWFVHCFLFCLLTLIFSPHNNYCYFLTNTVPLTGHVQERAEMQSDCLCFSDAGLERLCWWWVVAWALLTATWEASEGYLLLCECSDVFLHASIYEAPLGQLHSLTPLAECTQG